jgi:tRNA (cytidine/uridine-2'-O-)-methyltransferase
VVYTVHRVKRRDGFIEVVLIEPEIPPNTGNIARTCAGTGTVLHLVDPIGFSLDDRYLKRAGVDYWHLVDVKRHSSWEACLDALGRTPESGGFHFFTSHGGTNYADVVYGQHDVLVFGKESTGLGDAFLARYALYRRQIPMRGSVRSLNLSNAVAIALYEGLRQQAFPDLTLN